MKPRNKRLNDILRSKKGGRHVPAHKKKPKHKAWADELEEVGSSVKSARLVSG